MARFRVYADVKASFSSYVIVESDSEETAWKMDEGDLSELKEAFADDWGINPDHITGISIYDVEAEDDDDDDDSEEEEVA